MWPPNYGVFITYEKFVEIERMAMAKAYVQLLNRLEEVKQNDTLTHP